jgi:hypothetical protein
MKVERYGKYWTLLKNLSLKGIKNLNKKNFHKKFIRRIVDFKLKF